MIHPTKSQLHWDDLPVKTYEEMEVILRASHFYPDPVIKNDKVVGYTVDCPAIIFMGEKTDRIKEILGDSVNITPNKNDGTISITLKKSKK